MQTLFVINIMAYVAFMVAGTLALYHATKMAWDDPLLRSFCLMVDAATVIGLLWLISHVL